MKEIFKQRFVSENNPDLKREKTREDEKAHSDNTLFADLLSSYDCRGEILEQMAIMNNNLRGLIESPEKQDEHASGQEIKERLREMLEGAERRMHKIDTERREELRKEFKRFFLDLDTFLFKYPSGSQTEYVLDQVRKMINTAEIENELTRLLPKGITALGIAFAIADRSIKDDILLQIGRIHVGNIREQTRALEKLEQETREEFRAAIRKGVADGWLPMSAEESLGRIDHVSVALQDSLGDLYSQTWGERRLHGRILVNNEQLQAPLIPLLKKTLFHEFLHEISGRSITIDTTTDTESHDHNKTTTRQIREHKLGLLIGGSNSWINEATTELLALRLSGYAGDENGTYQGSKVYQEERTELDRLITLGLQESIVLEAYFENFALEDNEKEARRRRGRAYKAFRTQLRDLVGPEELFRIDNQFTLKNIAEKLAHYHAIPTEDPETLREKYREQAETTCYRIEVIIGTKDDARPGSQVRQIFLWPSRPIELADRTLSVEEQWEKSHIPLFLENTKKAARGNLTYTVEKTY